MRRVALIYDATLPYDLKVVRGIARYVQEGAPFNIYIEEDALKNQKLPNLSIGEEKEQAKTLDFLNDL